MTTTTAFDASSYLPGAIAPVTAAGAAPAIVRVIHQLELAAARFAMRHDFFAEGKADTCTDIAAKLQHFGSFASDKQAAFAHKLIGWSLPHGVAHPLEGPQEAPGAPSAAPVVPEPAQAAATRLPRLFELMQRLSRLTIGAITIARKNQDSLCWIKVEGQERVVGRITEGGTVTLFSRPGLDQPDLLSRLAGIEQDPEAAAVRHGRASGRCAVCGRDITNPESTERGIGPICSSKF